MPKARRATQQKSKITKLLRDIDAFGQPVQLFFDGQNVHKTVTGGFITILIFGILISALANSVIGLVNKYELKIQEKSDYFMNPPQLQVTKDQFMFSVGLQDPTITLNNSIFSYVASTFIETRINNKVERKNVNFSLAPCTLQDFQDYADGYYQNYLNQTLCPQNNSFIMEGAYGNNLYQYIKLSVMKCVNGSHPNVTCASPAAIDEYFYQKSKVELSLFFMNRVANPFDYESPALEFLDIQQWILSPLGKLSRSTNIFFRQLSISSYDNMVGYGNPDNYTTVSFGQDRQDYTYIPNNNSNIYVEIYLRSSNYVTAYYRTYQTLPQVLSFIGGLWNILSVVLGYIAAAINAHIYKLTLANVLYDFDARLCESPQEKKRREIEFQTKMSTMNQNSLKSVIMSKFQELTKIRATLYYSIKEHLIALTMPCFMSKRLEFKEKLLEQAYIKMASDMDIRLILKRIQDVEKLKHILLTPSQYNIFNFVPPCIIKINDGPKDKDQDIFLDNASPLSSQVNNEEDIVSASVINNSTRNKEKSKTKRGTTKRLTQTFIDPCQELNKYYDHSDMYKELKKLQETDTISKNIIESLNPQIVEIFEIINKKQRTLIQQSSHDELVDEIPYKNIIEADNQSIQHDMIDKTNNPNNNNNNDKNNNNNDDFTNANNSPHLSKEETLNKNCYSSIKIELTQSVENSNAISHNKAEEQHIHDIDSKISNKFNLQNENEQQPQHIFDIGPEDEHINQRDNSYGHIHLTQSIPKEKRSIYEFKSPPELHYNSNYRASDNLISHPERSVRNKLIKSKTIAFDKK